MTEVLFVKNLLESKWQTSISGRDTDVPKPTFVLQKENFKKRLRSEDVAYVATGADTTYTPNGVGWDHQTIETAVVVQYRAATRSTNTGYDNGYKRLVGDRNGPDGLQPADSHDGIIGETVRIVLDNRKRPQEWTRFGTDASGSPLRVQDLADIGGKNYFRVDVLIPAAILDNEIDTST